MLYTDFFIWVFVFFCDCRHRVLSLCSNGSCDLEVRGFNLFTAIGKLILLCQRLNSCYRYQSYWNNPFGFARGHVVVTWAGFIKERAIFNWSLNLDQTINWVELSPWRKLEAQNLIRFCGAFWVSKSNTKSTQAITQAAPAFHNPRPPPKQALFFHYGKRNQNPKVMRIPKFLQQPNQRQSKSSRDSTLGNLFTIRKRSI